MQINRQIWRANSIASWLLLGVVWTGWCESALAATVTRGPYLQLGTPNSIVVRWRTDAPTDSEVRYGAAPGSLTFHANSSTVTTDHEITLGGLTPDTQYYYALEIDGRLDRKKAGEFRTFPAPGPASFTIAFASTEPTPVTASYPVPQEKPVTPGTLLLPEVMSWKIVAAPAAPVYCALANE